MSNPTTTTSHFHVTHERVCDGHLLTLEKGNKSKQVTVTAADIIEWTDGEGRTFGLDDCDNVITDTARVGQRPETYPAHDWIEDFFSTTDWEAFAKSLPAYNALKPSVNLRVLSAHALRAANKGSYSLIPHYISSKPSKPVWWAYDRDGKWLMVDGSKVELNEQDVIDFVGNYHYMKSDETGFYVIRHSRKNGDKKMYFGFETMVQMANEALWWEYSQHLAAKVAA